MPSSPLPHTSPAAFVAAMGAAVTGVTVVTTDGPAGRFGLTVSAMASVSADPALLLICVNRASPLLDALCANGCFAVNVLGEHQAAIADTFAGRPVAGEPYAFDCATWEDGPTGCPLLVGAAARFDCARASASQAGSHTVVLGSVLEASRGAVRPLAYARRGYARTTAIAPANRAGADAPVRYRGSASA
jgi:flavin reductase